MATGSETGWGRINQLLAGVSALETPLLLQIKKFGYAITAIVLVVGALTFAYGRFVEGVPFVEIFQAVTGIAVSMIPEGLPALITIPLAIGVQRKASRNAIVTRLPAVRSVRQSRRCTRRSRRSMMPKRSWRTPRTASAIRSSRPESPEQSPPELPRRAKWCSPDR